ncbi:hypothetical protein GUI12_04360 [Anaplasmataceae bacterium AB001_6]|nr:hypothetical protein GUI12_04360 [Anaplasmataceae bacterium AB001_6]
MRSIKIKKIGIKQAFFVSSILLCATLTHSISDIMAARPISPEESGSNHSYIPKILNNTYNSLYNFLFAKNDNSQLESVQNEHDDQSQEEIERKKREKVNNFLVNFIETEKLKRTGNNKKSDKNAAYPVPNPAVEYDETSGNTDYLYTGGEISIGYDFVKSNSVPLIAELSFNLAKLHGHTESTNQSLNRTEFQAIGSVYLLPTTINKTKRKMRKREKALPYLNAGIGIKHAAHDSAINLQKGSYNTGIGTLGVGIFIPLKNNSQIEIGYRMTKDLSSSERTIIDSDDLKRYENSCILHTAKIGIMTYI